MMAQQHATAAATPEDEPNRIFWARAYIRNHRQADRLNELAGRQSTSRQDRSAFIGGACSLAHTARDYLGYAIESGGLLFCWTGSALEGGAA